MSHKETVVNPGCHATLPTRIMEYISIVDGLGIRIVLVLRNVTAGNCHSVVIIDVLCLIFLCQSAQIFEKSRATSNF